MPYEINYVAVYKLIVKFRKLSLYQYMKNKRIYNLRFLSVLSILLWMGFMCVMIFNIIFQQWNFIGYGDGNVMLLILNSPEKNPTPKWLIGVEFIRVIYFAIWEFPPIKAILPVNIQTIEGCLRIMGIILMGISSIIIFLFSNKRLSYLLLIITPIWLIFSTGYFEYYPLIVWLFAGILLWLFNGHFKEKAPQTIGLTAGFLPLLYLGFAPVSIIILLVYVVSFPKRTLKLMIYLCLSFLLILKICWYSSLPDFFNKLYGDMLFGERFTIFQKYQGKSQSATSIFFNLNYAFSFEHISDIYFMVMWGGGLLQLILIIVGIYLFFKCDNKKNIYKDPRFYLAGGFLFWGIYYIWMMIPKLGPVQDIDLFWMPYLIFSFLCGLLFDWIFIQKPQWSKFYYLILIIMGIYSVTIVNTLLLSGLVL